MNMIRLIAQNTENEDNKIFLHAITENGNLCARQEQMGYEVVGQNQLYPFVLKSPKNLQDAIMDFGCLNDEDCSHYTAATNLFAKSIAVGEYFTITEEGEEYTMRIIHTKEIA